MKNKSDARTGILCAMACEAIYGFSYLFTKNATEHASELSLLGWRFFIAILVMGTLALLGVLKINLKGKNLRPLLIVALFCPVIYFTGETFGISNTTASESGAIIACIPVASLVASSLILKKKPTRNQVVGILITLFGVLVTVFAVGISSSLSVVGYLCLVMGVIAYALYSVFVEKAEEYTGEEITFVMLLAGAVVFVTVALIEGIVSGDLMGLIRLPFTNGSFLSACLYQGICCSILAFFLSNVAIAKIGVNRVSSFVGLSTVVAIVAGIVILGEPFTALQVVGAVMIIAGVYIANLKLKE